MTSIQVLFEVPDDILQKLADGTYERVGGVIRTMDDKKVVAWLNEAGETLKDSTPGQGLPDILAGQQLLMGLQVANLAVSVVGFVVVYRKLQQVERLLQGIDQKMDRVVQGQEWLDNKQLIAQLAPLMAATRTLQGVHRLQDRENARLKLLDADSRLGEADEYFRNVLGLMLANELEARRPEEFAACYRAWLMANQGRVNAMAALEEMPEALDRLSTFKTLHGDFGKRYQDVRKDHMRALQAGGRGGHADVVLGQLTQQMVGAHEIVRGQLIQLEFLASKRLPLPTTEHDGSAPAYSVCVISP